MRGLGFRYVVGVICVALLGSALEDMLSRGENVWFGGLQLAAALIDIGEENVLWGRLPLPAMRELKFHFGLLSLLDVEQVPLRYFPGRTVQCGVKLGPGIVRGGLLV